MFVFLQHRVDSDNKININNKNYDLLSSNYFPFAVLGVSYIVPDNF